MIYRTIVRNFCTAVANTGGNYQSLDTTLSLTNKTRQLFREFCKTPELLLLDTIFKDFGHQLRVTGGAVRDVLCGQQPDDIDLATDATPDQMRHMIRDLSNIWLIKTSSGPRNGTVMARVNDRINYEITSLHKWTDERPGKPIYVKDWAIDAAHRDLTINAMYMDFNDQLYDYYDGAGDLRRRVIRFVGDGTGESAVRQNPITILRYFRFYSQYGPTDGHDPQALATIARYRHLLMASHGQALWKELKKVLAHSQCYNAVNTMFNDIQIGQYLGFSKDHFLTHDLSEFTDVCNRMAIAQRNGLIKDWDPTTLFATLFDNERELSPVASRLQLAAAEKRNVQFILKNRRTFASTDSLDLRQQLILTPKDNQKWLRQVFIECSKYCDRFDQIDSIASQALPDFPFTGHLFADRPMPNRNELKRVLNELKLFWFKQDFQCTDDDLKCQLDRLLSESQKS